MTVAPVSGRRRSLLFKVFGPADVGPFDPTPAPPSAKCCEDCGHRWTDHEIVRYSRASRAICPTGPSQAAAG